MTFATRIVFMGSPHLAAPTLRALAGDYQLVGVVTQPDRPAGRGRALVSPAVKTLAQSLDLPVIQPARLDQPDAINQIRRWEPELIVVVAFGQILPPKVLDLPSYGCLNVHASLLPRWRGAAPIQAAILAGDTETGVTIMKMDPGLDTGPILTQRSIPILPEDTTSTLGNKLADLGAGLLLSTLPGYLAGEIIPRHQPDRGVTHARLLKKEHGLLDFSKPALELARSVRAFNPWPSTWMHWHGQPLKIHQAHAVPEKSNPGKRMIFTGLPAVGTTDGILIIDSLQPAGKKVMSGKAFLAGARDWAEK